MIRCDTHSGPASVGDKRPFDPTVIDWEERNLMSRKGGFPGGMAMPGNMNNLLKQAQRMQTQLQENKKALDEKEFSFTAGGGAVSVTILGTKEIKELNIDKDAVDPEDVETLQDMIIAAVNGAMQQVDQESEKLLGGMTGGLGF